MNYLIERPPAPFLFVATVLLASSLLAMSVAADEDEDKIEDVCCGQPLPPVDGSNNSGPGDGTGSSNAATNSKEAGDAGLDYSPCGAEAKVAAVQDLDAATVRKRRIPRQLARTREGPG